MWTDPIHVSRRQMLRQTAGGFGALALAGMFADLARADAAPDLLGARPAHFAARAKNVIFFFATGGVSHVDTFDYKPKLYADAGQRFGVDSQNKSTFLKRPHWGFKRYGKSGLHVAD